MSTAACIHACESLPVEPSLDQPLFFVHVPKAAGTSFNQLLLRRFPHGAIRWLRHDDDAYVANRLDLGRHICYAGHEVYRFAEFLPNPPVVMTILREPVERTISAFYFIREYAAESLRVNRAIPGWMARTCDLSLEEFLEQEPLAARQNLGNMQTGIFSHPVMPHLTECEVRVTDLEIAKRNLAHCAVVGLAERLGETLELVGHSFELPVPERTPWDNKTLARPKVAEIEPALLRTLRDQTSLDAELYQFGVELFEQQLLAMEQRKLRTRPARHRSPIAICNFEGVIPGDGWLPLEPSILGSFCWSDGHAWVELPIAGRGPLSVTVRIVMALHPDQVGDLGLSVNGRRIPTVVRTESQPGWTLQGTVAVPATEEEAGHVRLSLRVPQLVRPCDVIAGCTDARSLGVAVQKIELRFPEPLPSAMSRVA